MKHTPGPWFVEYDGPSNPIITTGTRERFNVLAHVKTPNDPYETEANTRLIAKAPEMLAILHRLREAEQNTTPGNWDLIVSQAVDDAMALLAEVEKGQ